MTTTLTRRSPKAADSEFRLNEDGIFVPDTPVQHRDDEYDDFHMEMLLDMQERHFWYRGRFRFLKESVKRTCRSKAGKSKPRAAIDLGGGCGGWIEYLRQRMPALFDEWALADSSYRALQLAARAVDPEIARYQVDLQELPWRQRWDHVFLLDVLEHIPDDVAALGKIRSILRPGGTLFVTTPALRFFWSHNDELVHHVRRYSRHDFRRLAARAGFELCDTRYFMTFLSPLLLASRMRRPDIGNMNPDQIRAYLRRKHAVPAGPINEILTLLFSLETPIGHWLPFPWGTSILGVFRRPAHPD